MKSVFWIMAGLTLLIVSGCVKEDYSKVSKSLVFKPNVSVPIGSRNVTVSKPLGNLTVDTLIATDTIDFAFSDLGANRKYVETLMFRVQTTNSYPAKALVSVDYYDANGIILGSFTKLEPLILSKPSVDSVAGTTGSITNLKDIFLTSGEIDQLENAKKIIVTTVMTDMVLANALLLNWDKFSVAVTVGMQAQLIKEN